MKSIVESLKKTLSFTGKSDRKELLTFFLFDIIYLAICFIYFFLMPDDLVCNLTTIGFIIPLIIQTYFIISLFSCMVRRIHDTGRNGYFILCPVYGIVLLFFPSAQNTQSKKANTLSSIFGKILAVVFSLILSFVLIGYVNIPARTLSKNISNHFYNKKLEKYKEIGKKQEQEKAKEEKKAEENLEHELSKLAKVPAFMVIKEDGTPAYTIPHGIKNPYDSKELGDYLESDTEEVFEENVWKKLPASTIVKSLFAKKDPYGKEWLCVDCTISNDSEVCFIKSDSLVEYTDTPSPEILEKYNTDYLEKECLDEFEAYKDLWENE